MITLDGVKTLFKHHCKHQEHYAHFVKTCDEMGCDFNWHGCHDCVLRHVDYGITKTAITGNIVRDLCFLIWHGDGLENTNLTREV